LRREGFGGPIRVIGDERHAPYDRPPLSKHLLAGKVTAAQIVLHPADDLDVDWHLGRRVTGLDLPTRTLVVEGDDGRTDEPFDGLVIATGATPRTLPGADRLRGVFVLRTLDDSLALGEALAGASRLVVIGAGFIGSEVASTAKSRGVDVTVLEALPVPLARALGERMGGVLGRLHGRNGVDLRCGVGVAALEDDGAGAVRRVRLVDGTAVDADVVVVGVGVRPATDWLDDSGVALADGVLCDEWCRVLDHHGDAVPGVVAAGDVARWQARRFAAPLRVEHWTNAAEQGSFAAGTLLHGGGAGCEPYDPVPYFWSDQYRSKIQFVGHASGEDELAVVEGSLDDDRFVVAYGRDGRLVGALGLNRPARVMAWRARILDGAAFPPPTE
jgi:NADPH-dependent 2,4-dienoyl-CoA reductase/sulfur reductase-like enzyme